MNTTIEKTFACGFCKKIFKTKKTMLTHQRTVKSCLLIQGQNADLYTCGKCEKSFTTTTALKNHKCIVETKEQERQKDLAMNELELIKNEIQMYKDLLSQKDKEIEELHIENQKVKDERDNYYTLITSITNNTKSKRPIYNRLFEDTDRVKDKIMTKLTYNYMKNELKGLANFVKEHIINDDYVCYDLSRNIYKYVDENNKLITDEKCEKMITLLMDCGLIKRLSMIANDFKADTVLFDTIIEKYMKITHELKNHPIKFCKLLV